MNLELEMAFTPYRGSCLDPLLVGGEIRQCRRPQGHTDVHASGFGTGLVTWDE